AFTKDSPIIHEELGDYKVQVAGVHAIPNSNVANLTKIRKGDSDSGLSKSDVVIESEFSFSPSDHGAVETRVARVEILLDDRVMIYSSTQGHFYYIKLLDQFVKIEIWKISVHVPFVGGAFGGKGTVQLEFLVYLPSRAVDGKMVTLFISREQA